MKRSIRLILDDEMDSKLHEIAFQEHRTFSNLVMKWITERLIQEEEREEK